MPIKELILQTFMVPYAMRKRLFQALWVPVLLTMACETFIGILFTEKVPGETTMYWLAEFLTFLIYVVIAINVHRLLLIGGDAVPKLGVLKWSMRETRFFIWLVVIFALAFVTFYVMAMPTLTIFFNIIPDSMIENAAPPFVDFMSVVLNLFFVGLILGRLSPIFPHVALERHKSTSLRWAWNMTKGNTWRLLIVISIVPSVPFYILDWIFKLIDTGLDIVITRALYSIPYCVLTVFMVSAASVTYRWLMQNQETNVANA